MTVLGIDDTDSRKGGMCTTWIASEIVRRLPTESVAHTFLVRLHPAVPHKTRGNGAVALQTGCAEARLMRVTDQVIQEYAVREDPETNPGVVALPNEPTAVEPLRAFAEDAVRTTLTRARARHVLEQAGGAWREYGNGRGIIGATAAVGAVCGHAGDVPDDGVFVDWTYEQILYREPDRWGSERTVTVPRERPAAPAVWDTIDPVTGTPVCVPHSPCPVLAGIRGDDPSAIRRVSREIGGEPVARAELFITNQGTDGHLRPGVIGDLKDGHSYRVKGTVSSAPVTREGGHVVVRLRHDGATCEGLAFAPTGRFRDHVRALRPGDTIIACGEADDGALKLEKFALTGRALTETANPPCPICDRSMKSAGRGQGYRCRSCDTGAPRRIRRATNRELSPGWYEVPPVARRHLAKPLVRSQYSLPMHPTSE